jgi:uncharacterized protein (DUF1697 family)
MVFSLGMNCYVAFLRGVMPTTATMENLREAFRAAGWTEVRTVLASGNVVFRRSSAALSAIEQEVESALRSHLNRDFFTIIRPIEVLRGILAADPYRKFRLKPGSKRVVTFMRGKPRAAIRLPVEDNGSRILAIRNTEAYSVYIPNPRGPVFMTLIERTFGKNVTTRTWETLKKVVRSASELG